MVDRLPAGSVLDEVFGPGAGSEPEARAEGSSRVFVRSQDHLAVNSAAAKGLRLTASEALRYFGFERLLEVLEFGSAVLPSSVEEPAKTIRHRIEALGLTPSQVAKAAGLDNEDVVSAEQSSRRTPVQVLVKIAQALALDENAIGLTPGALGDAKLAVRLRRLRAESHEGRRLPVAQMCEAAWVIKRQAQLSAWLQGPPAPVCVNEPIEGVPWKQGLRLAAATRDWLGLKPAAPVQSMRKLLEEKLKVPLVQMDLPVWLGGATLANGGVRGIVANVSGPNANPWIRRSTLAHELCHLLWDKPYDLQTLRVDAYSSMSTFQTQTSGLSDKVEARANAFSAAFLAPQQAALDVFNGCSSAEEGLRKVMEVFGVSFTVAKYQVWNAPGSSRNRRMAVPDLTVDTAASDEWKATESFATDYFPLQSVRLSRRGLFAGLVGCAHAQGTIHADSAAMLLGCGREDFLASFAAINSLYAGDLTQPTPIKRPLTLRAKPVTLEPLRAPKHSPALTAGVIPKGKRH